MSYAATDRNHSGQTRPNANSNDLYSSNVTSGHFLGAVPRGWMTSRGGTYVTQAPTGQNPTQAGPQRANSRPVVVQSRNVHTPPLATNAEQALIVALQPNTLQTPPSDSVPTPGGDNTPLDRHNGIEDFDTDQPALFRSDTAGLAGQARAIFQPAPANGRPHSQTDAEASLNSAIFNSLASAIRFNPMPTDHVTNRPSATGISSPTLIAPQSPDRHQTAPSVGNTPSRILGSNSVIRQSSSSAMRPPSFTSSPFVQSPSLPVTESFNFSRTGNRLQTSPNIDPSSLGVSNQLLSTGSNQPGSITQQLMLDHLNQRIAAFTVGQSVTIVDNIRITWLRSACECGDVPYMLVHQLTCIHSVDPQYLASKLSISPSLTQSLGLLNYILADNRCLTPGILTIFCNFVTPMNTFAMDENTRTWIPRLTPILELIAIRWEELRIKVFTRGSPPTAREIAESIDFNSPILSQTIYTNLFYQLFPQAATQFAQDAFKLFSASQQIFYRFKNRESIDAERELQTFLSSFGDLVNRYKQRPATMFRPLNLTSHGNMGPARMLIGSSGPAMNHTTSASPLTMTRHVHTNVDRFHSNLNTSAPLVNIAPVSSSALVAAHVSNTHRLFPRRGQTLPITVNPDPTRAALHQAHLANPPLQFDGQDIGSQADSRVYSFLETRLGESKIIDEETFFVTWSIAVPPEMLGRRVLHSSPPNSNPFGKATRIAQNGSLTFHLRCVRILNKEQPLDESSYTTTATYWPENIFISTNRTHLEFRRKALHGKDLPVDVTHLIEQEENEIKLSYQATDKDKGKCFVITLEAINMLHLSAVTQLLRIIDAQASQAAIVRSFRAIADDDDIVMADTHISIDLVDPFTARVFDKPIRGSTCRHRECFDLEAYLQSRSCRNRDGLVQPDEWKCPICGKDARPTSLVVDGFLLQVKEKLIADNKENTKAILVKEDGSWEPKDSNPDTASTHGGTASAEPNSTVAMAMRYEDKAINDSNPSYPAATTEPAIIILDDDD